MTTDPGDQLDPTQPLSLSDLIDDDDESIHHATDAERAAMAHEQEHTSTSDISS
jgi:hypothetical protein